MSDKREAALNELRELRLALYRNAANLDEVISSIEMDLPGAGVSLEDYYLSHARAHRMSYVKARGVLDLPGKELDIWNDLING